ncbi:hypothetical protein HOD96_00240 [Candidatus Falkowbacteria bacterium]|jgi:hypothetical protein|nr:hypothetical protein [Candidatus Falkowbacteria bacterium]MBT4432840.1 hypothetical protein [Candidatus Falkowbacteria bacterium]
MTRYTALVIQNKDNDIRCEPYGQDKKTGKWAGAVNIYHDGFFHTTLLSTNPAFDSPEKAVIFTKSVVKNIRATDLSA